MRRGWRPKLQAALVIGLALWFVRHVIRTPTPRLRAVSVDEAFTLPLLPVTVRVVDSTAADVSGDGFCGSDLFRDVLRRRTFLWLAGDASVNWPADFTLDCAELSNGNVHYAMLWPDGRKVYGAAIERLGGSDGDETAARQIARNLAVERHVDAAGAVAYMAANQNRFAERGAARLQDGGDEEAEQYLFLGLESNMDPAALYYGLAKACADQGLADRAYWYFAAYLESTRQSPDAAADKVDAVFGSMPESPARSPRDSDILDRWRSAQDASNWNDALVYQKQLVLETPWNESLYERAARAYEQAGWAPLAANWRARLDLARRVNADQARIRRLQDMVNPS